MYNKITTILLVFAFAKAIISCTQEPKLEQEIQAIPLQVELVRFHEEFANAQLSDLPRLKEQFPQFFPTVVSDSIWKAKIAGQDTIQNVLEKAVASADFDYQNIQKEVELVMKHVEYYFPEFEPVPVITVLSEVDDDLKVVPTPQFLLIGIDNYLGPDHQLYKGISKYKSVTLDRDRLAADVALAYAKLFVPPVSSRGFLDQMIYYGKLHYVQQLFAPASTPAQLMGYPENKMQFAQENEEYVYRYFVDKELLYKSDQQLISRFLLPAPFSKFYLEIDQDTPGGIAQYIGYQIVSSYAATNNAAVDEIIRTSATDIFNKSRYKPRS
ncbi:gliding motility lipoprotein GldB [Nonlabens marinus]|uniref:Gliding motility protein GldB n=1 Tax=Nonlabens marinus S1-08 TaxID=1454201 RepID=W8VNA8_9FLAO|nr:gliding motility protein [Nonlabens marinus]BAO54339.1 gliding motility protein GldB [Nonlabens marinus S1-08]